jgi:hydroxymethylbilane synthase
MITIGTRGSALALTQTGWIERQIHSIFPNEEIFIKTITTSADKDQTTSIRSGPAIGVFVKEIEQALIAKEIDLAVHSMKDMPTQSATGLKIAAIPEREDARDALIAAGSAQSLRDLPAGSLVGTGSVRRQAQILALYPHLKVADIRGNVDTRLKKLQEGAYHAIILACAGLNRLGLQNRITARLEFDEMLPAPGQGALAIETRINDPQVERIAEALNHPPTAAAVLAERSFLQRIGGGCNIPAAVYAKLNADSIEIEGLIASPDGKRIVRDSLQEKISMANEAAKALADKILAAGGREILKKLNLY